MRRIIFALAITGALFTIRTAAQELPKREFRGVWISTVANIDWPAAPGNSVQAQKDLLVSILDKLAGAGFNAVVFQVRPECDAMYQSPYEPWSYYLMGAQGAPPVPLYDPLQFAVDEAHKRGLEIHAWFNPYRAVRIVGLFPISPQHITVTHPEWILTIGSLKMLDPGLPAVRDYVAKVLADVTRRYDVDGVHMDDYFYASGITNQDAATYAADPRGLALGDWRRDNVNRLIRQINDSVKVIKPWVKFGMSPAGIWKNGVPPGTTGQDNYSVIYCDAVAWLQGQYIDYLAPQLYWKFGGGQDYALLQPWWSSQRNGRHLYPGLATYRIGQAAFGGSSEVANQIRFNRSTENTQGSIQFTTNNITIGNLGNIADTLRGDLFRYPALLPVMAWKDTIPPYAPRGITYGPLIAGGTAGFRWEPPSPAPDGDSASRYGLYRFDHYPAAPELNDTRNLIAVVGNRQWTPPVPSGTGPYYYLATALDRNYNESDSSFVLVVQPGAAPQLVLPANNSSGLPDSVLLTWRRNPLATSYQVRVSTDSAFVAPPFISASGVNDTTLKVRALLGQARYFWQVRASTAGGSGAYGTAFVFRTGFPLAANPIFPANSTDKVPLAVTLRWSRPAGGESYRVQVGRASDFAVPVLDTTGLADTLLAIGPLQPTTIYFWHVKAANAAGTSAWSATFIFRTDIQSGVSTQEEVPSEYGLTQNYPNPFNPATTIGYQIPAAGRVTLVVYDLLGREVDTLVNEDRAAGRYQVTWNAANRSSGVYFLRMTAGSYVAVKRMMFIK